ncbi:hypothetical protein NPIL_603941 [Nephila pilipes]|uniref:Uncharacterized protein n=1 Tax=Nephila pilipes TaxID=299642 RepID=A0A8X6PIV7_NEPPI|nr:hypothetical protein NPIL_603941 [Nephila pilipes]
MNDGGIDASLDAVVLRQEGCECDLGVGKRKGVNLVDRRWGVNKGPYLLLRGSSSHVYHRSPGSQDLCSVDH